MDELVKASIATVEAKKKGQVPWDLDVPYDQPYHVWRLNGWQSTQPSRTYGETRIPSIALYSWNIDFMLPFPDSRMRLAIRHLETLVEQEIPTVIFFAECLESDLKLIAGDSWVRKRFNITDVDGSYWQSGHYGTTILVDQRLPVRACFRVHYKQTRMERDGLFLDVALGPGKTVRLCNTHAESLALDPPFRPAQLKLCSQYMQDEKISGAVLAGDLNAIQDFDRHLHTDNELRDAYLEMGGREDDVEGHTWGQQAATSQRERFGGSRMDKILFCGGIRIRSFERFGMGVELEDASEREHVVSLGFDKPWITDHLGVHAIFDVTAE
ncbi:hypothetical protein BAUCODRAFT_25760 [Baudoinia panamericana UAMH 10762]|uniref:Endonuclease/exonuclease/phosphatase domain-containing protein n=1 Tax=Baudoinia panamericana (strain UAMH 10762) TaxID=717646 RepID=M2MSW1_BAUPA|nr:uncharacterized protein BAUCODRAFT_25760 [Baudoinia panamericana UAMH 10762]EMC94598.1 hypothetical protein BAUCODRAFT_25760 [Baudoinia panamericana UAMH 10762]